MTSTQVGGRYAQVHWEACSGERFLGPKLSKFEDWPQEGLEEERPRQIEQHLQALRGNELLWGVGVSFQQDPT